MLGIGECEEVTCSMFWGREAKSASAK